MDVSGRCVRVGQVWLVRQSSVDVGPGDWYRRKQEPKTPTHQLNVKHVQRDQNMLGQGIMMGVLGKAALHGSHRRLDLSNWNGSLCRPLSERVYTIMSPIIMGAW